MPRLNPQKRFNVHERLILFILDRAKRMLSQRQISLKSGMAWKTTKKYIDSLEKKQYVQCIDKGNVKMCYLMKK